MSRPSIPKRLQQEVLYACAYRCVVCQSPGCQIHHIDQDNSNNVEANLVALCPNHHGEAHTKRDHGKNLDAAALHSAKQKWTEAVRVHRESQATLEGQKTLIGASSFLSAGIAWGYINHRRVSEMSDPSSLVGPSKLAFDYCVGSGLVDSSGVPIKPATWMPGSTIGANTVYDWFPFGDDQRFHRFYTGLVDGIVVAGNPIQFDANSWAAENIDRLVESGTLLLIKAHFSFKTVSSSPENEHRRVHFSKNGASIEFFVDTQNMMGDTSIYNSFCGRRTTTALVLVKDIASTAGKVEMSATPLALGVGFQFGLPKPNSGAGNGVAT